MGKDKKVDPIKLAAKKARAQAKQQKNTIKRNKKELKETGEEDIESIIAEFIEKDRKRVAVTITSCLQPSPRSNFSLTSLPNNEMILFGGEYCDGESTIVYNDLFRWNVEKNEWKIIESLNTPPPRCSHQSVFFKDQLYIFGGEYATLDQFHHYRDMWALDIRTNVWREIQFKGDGPSARSGHRMVVWRNYLVLFGGFYEALKEVRWYNDLYIFSFQEEKWLQIPPRPYLPLPKPRSGFLMVLHPAEDSFFIFGGYSKEKDASKKSEGKIHTDMWMLNLRGILPSSGGSGGIGLTRLDITKATWQKISNKGSPPSPRCGASMITYKNKGIYFGGVFDNEGPRHTIQSVFYNDLYAFDFERKRWYELGVKHSTGGEKKKRRKQPSSNTESKGNGDDNNNDSDNDSENDNDSDNDNENDDDDNNDQQNGQLSLQNQENLFGYIDDNGNIVYVNIDQEEIEEISNSTESIEKLNVEGLNLNNNDTVSTNDVTINLLSSQQLNNTNEIQNTIETTNSTLTSTNINTSLSSTTISESDKLRSAFLEEETNEINQLNTLQQSKLELPTNSNPLKQYFMNFVNCPVGRINCQMVMRGCSLYIYGGVIEFGDVEITLDDCWSLDLNKRDKWKTILSGHMNELVWKGNDGDDQSERTGDGDSDNDDSDSDDDDENDDDSDDNENDEDNENEQQSNKKKSKKKDKKHKEETNDDNHRNGNDNDNENENEKKGRKSKSRGGIRGEMDEIRSQLPDNGEDLNRIPLTGSQLTNSNNNNNTTVNTGKSNSKNTLKTNSNIESLRDFYSRTNNYWKQYAIEMWLKGAVNLDGVLIPVEEQTLTQQIPKEELGEKELKKIGFSLCQLHYEEIYPLITRLTELEELMDSQQSSKHDKQSEKKNKRNK